MFGAGSSLLNVSWSAFSTHFAFSELQRIGQCQFDELQHWPVFEERFNEQIKKLKEVGIDLKLEKAVIQDENAEDEENLELAVENTAAKGQK
jgi:hypothetical protein